MRFRHFVSLLLIAGLALAACGAAQVLAPRLTLNEAAHNLADQPRVGFTLSLVGTDKDAIALFSEGEEDVTPEDQKSMLTVLKSQLNMVFDQGPDADSASDDAVALDASVGGLADAVQFRTAGTTMYARADVDKLIELFGGSTADLTEFVQGAKEGGFDFVAQGAAGKWLSADVAPLQSFFKGMAGRAGALAGMGSFGADQIKQFRDAFSAAWGSDITPDRIGKDDIGDHLRLTSSPRQIYDRFLPALRQLPGLPMAEFPPSTDVPDKDFHLDVWVKDKKIVRAEFDLAQFSESPTPPGHVVLRLDINHTAAGIVLPKDTVKVDLLEMFGRFSAGLAGVGGPT